MNKTNYDIFQELKNKIPNDSKRHTLEGLVIISSAMKTADEFGLSINKDRFGYESAKKSINNFSELEIIDNNLNPLKFENDLHLPEKYKSINLKNFHELLRTSIRIANLFNIKNQIDYNLLEKIGEKLDSNFERLYKKRDLEINPEKRTVKAQTKILKIEAFYFGINARETYKKNRR